MTEADKRIAAKEFAEEWKDRGDEKQDTQVFWITLLQNVFDVENTAKRVKFEYPIKSETTKFIDAYINETKVLIEQKGKDIDLTKKYRQSDGAMLTAFGQARRYAGGLPHDMNPRWIVVCNFQEFHIHDMNRPGDDPEILYIADLEKEYYRLKFLVNQEDENIKKETEVSIEAGRLVGVLYNALLKQYINPEDPETLKNLNVLCVRLVFCLYAEDAGIFGSHTQFHDYLDKYKGLDARRALIDLFNVLDTDYKDRDPYLDDELASFPYVNGGLFEKKNTEIPKLDENILNLLLEKASAGFDWSVISPTIFGAVFESTLNPETRRKGGMHYTSIENIHKVIDPLFLDDLKEEFLKIKETSVIRTREAKLKDFQQKIAGLKFLDPACGSGNFLTETYLSLRRLENRILEELIICGKKTMEGQIMLGASNPIQVSIGQFYGIEINDFAATVAKTALWIAESQMMKETENVVHMTLDFLPLKSYDNIHEGNALRMDWNDVIPAEELDYIMGNPPFVGYSLQSKEQKADILSVYVDEKGKPYKTAGKIDFVSGWYMEACKYMQNTMINAALVSTNSITQGEQVSSVFKPLYERFNFQINFAHRTFIWDSEASIKAHVHCVIIGFSCYKNTKEKRIYENDRIVIAKEINPYLIDFSVVFVESRKKPLCDVLQMTTGNRPADGGNLIIEADKYEDFVKKEPMAIPYIKKLTGSEEYINNKVRYCLWFLNVNPADLIKMPEVTKRIEACRKDRLNGAPDRQKLAETPTLFRETKNPESYIIVPRVSSEQRKYVPLGFLDNNTIPTDSAVIIIDAREYEFGVLISNVHMAWMRTVAGRLKSDYRYSKDIVYNNFPWPNPTEEQKQKIEQTAHKILDARELYPQSSLADMYGEHMYLYPELVKAHQENDIAVMEAYGIHKGDKEYKSESACVAFLMKLYQELTETQK